MNGCKSGSMNFCRLLVFIALPKTLDTIWIQADHSCLSLWRTKIEWKTTGLYSNTSIYPHIHPALPMLSIGQYRHLKKITLRHWLTCWLQHLQVGWVLQHWIQSLLNIIVVSTRPFSSEICCNSITDPFTYDFRLHPSPMDSLQYKSVCFLNNQ